MFIVLLKFAGRKSEAGLYMQGHKDWLQQGFEAGVFLLAGSLPLQAGGLVLAHQASLAELQDRIRQDPFVAEGVVTAEVIEVAPARVDERLRFLLA